jgi:hypothetical protein
MAAVPRDQDQQQQGALRRLRDRQGRPEDLGVDGFSRTAEARGDAPGLRGVAVLYWRAGARRRLARAGSRHEVVGLIARTGRVSRRS